MPENLLHPHGIRHHSQIVDLGGLHVVQYALFLYDRLNQLAHFYRLGLFLLGLVVLRQSFEQAVHLVRGILKRLDHICPEFRVFGVALGIACQQTQLADQILDIVHDERHPAVELIETLRFGKRFLATGFRQIACDLTPDHTQHIEILPVQRTIDPGTSQQHQAGETIEMNQWHRYPCLLVSAHPVRDCGRVAFVIFISTQGVKFHNMTGIFKKRDGAV